MSNVNARDDEYTILRLKARSVEPMRVRGPVLEPVPVVPESRDCEGHEERMRAHAERVAREERRAGDRYAELVCDACGVVAPRKGNVSVPEGVKPLVDRPRWVCRQVAGYGTNVVFCAACFAVWGWGDAVTCSDERGR